MKAMTLGNPEDQINLSYESSANVDRKSHPLWKHIDALYEHAVIKPSQKIRNSLQEKLKISTNNNSQIEDHVTMNTERFEIEERGEVQFRDGSTYRGCWKGDYKWGYGIQTWADGS